MKKLIIQASEILEDKFKIKSQKTKLYIYEDIQEFLSKTKNSQAQSIFIPKDLSAHIPKDRLDLAIHEYHGHGLYCEQANYGKQMVLHEQNIDKMSEKQLAEALVIHEHLKPDFEGHALWTEDFVLTQLRRFDILESRLQELNNLSFNSRFHRNLKTQRDIYNRIKQFEQVNGIFELWYSLGFPRQFDKQTLLDITKEKLGTRYKNLIFLIHFGSNNQNGDIDLCAILEDNVKLDEYKHSRTIDISQFNYSDFLKRIDLFDIPITQPLLTGILIYGNKKDFNKLKIKLKNKKPNKRAIAHLHRRSRWCFDYATEYFSNQPITLTNLEITLSNLAYAISFYEFAQRYKNNERVIAMDELDSQLFKEIRTKLKNIEKEIDISNINHLILKVKKFLK